MTKYSHDALLALAGPYALGATTPEETRAIEQAMADSPELAAEILAYRQVVTDLVLAERGVAPSPDIRERLLGRIHTPSTSAPSAWRRRSYTPFLAAASVILLAGACFQFARMNRELGALRGKEQQVASQLERRDATLNTLLLAEKDLHIVHLKASDTLAGPGIQLFWDTRHQTGIVHAFRLPPAPAGRSYQLWAFVNNEPVSVRVFDTEPGGHALMEGVALPALTQSSPRIIVTVEPRGGSRAPTSVAVLGSAN